MKEIYLICAILLFIFLWLLAILIYKIFIRVKKYNIKLNKCLYLNKYGECSMKIDFNRKYQNEGLFGLCFLFTECDGICNMCELPTN